MTRELTTTRSRPLGSRAPSGFKAAKNLMRQRHDFVRWVHNTLGDTSLRALALEEGAYYFAHEHYEHQIAELRRKIKELYEYREKVVQKHQERRIRQAVEVEQLRTVMAELKPRRAQALREAKKILMPIEVEKERLEILRERETHEYERLRIQQEQRRFMQQAIASEVAERSVIRGEFIQQLEKLIDDPEMRRQAIEDYDRLMYELGGN